MKNFVLISLLLVGFSGKLIAQGPPVRLSTYTVDERTKLKEILLPMEAFNVAEYSSKAGAARGMVQLHFTNVKVGKFKRGALSVISRSGILISATLDADSEKSVERLMKQLTEQFGDPYKLEASGGRHHITWSSTKKSIYEITFFSNEAYTEASVTIEKR